MDTSQLKQMKRFRLGVRFVGAMFCLVSGVLLSAFIPTLFDPNSTIVYNGVRTSDYAPKLQAVIFTISFVVVGLAALVTPSKFINRLFVMRQSLKASIFSKKR